MDISRFESCILLFSLALVLALTSLTRYLGDPATNSPILQRLGMMHYIFGRYFILAMLLLLQQISACQFGFATTCRPSPAIVSVGVDESGSCCQGENCQFWDFIFDPSSSRKIIGEGSMGIVRTITHPTNHIVFVTKTFFPAGDESIAHFASTIQHEFDVSTRMQGSGFADTYALITNDQGVHMISEYLPLPLTRILPYLDEDDIHCIMSMLVQALHRLHNAGYAHRDIKPDNVLLTARGHAKLIDLGESIVLGRLAENYIGTPPYLAPEIYGSRHTGYDAARSDCWSLGVLILELYSGQLPWMTSDVGDSKFAEFTSNAEDHFVDLPESVRELVQGLLRVDPAGRSSIDDVVRSGAFAGGTCETDREGALHVRIDLM